MSRVTRVLLVSREFPPETGWGGIGTYTAHLADGLAEIGCEVHVLSVVPDQQRSTRITGHGAVVHRAPLRRPRGISKVSRLPHTWDRLSGALAVGTEVRRLESQTGRFDVAECPDWMAEGLLLTFRRSLPVVVRLHSSLAQTSPFLSDGGVDRTLAKRLERWQIGRADVLVGTEPVLSETSVEDGIAIPCPVPTREFSDVPSGHPTICFVGRFEDRKNPDVLVRALPGVLGAVPSARLRLIGRDTRDRSDRSVLGRLRDLARNLSVEHAIDVVDRWQTPQQIARHVERATVCVVPSRWESFGYTAAEAASRGRPVVASDIPALRSLVVPGVTGALVDPDDAEGWATALVDVLSDRDRATAMGRAGARHVADRCAPSMVAALTLRAYERARTGGGR